ncbi:MAG: universal stress protein [Moorea sp. SIO3I7]|uniref:universal stress protein n=1 Tax=unclassified Moorena TaxID=2683338 RepID=UPI0013BF247F|nr:MULTISPECIES: universal stress protein [unclassified Moorena]NEN98178.1 universal stress protein [Moorena sp. SIO3I7]NEO04481.1 universal stress protein [Moorena sp. SIO3I8]NEP22291.1 universal stress protein [Moorena sp. SIO3I6]
MAYKKILVAIDRSSQAEAVFEQALDLAAKEQSTLMLVHCLNWEPQEMMTPYVGLGTIADVDVYGSIRKVQQENLQKHVEENKEWLRSYAQQANDHGIAAEVSCELADPSVGICDLAQKWSADLIVLGRRGLGGLKEIVLGSVSNYVVHHAPCSVLVVQGVATPSLELTTTGTPVTRDTK